MQEIKLRLKVVSLKATYVGVKKIETHFYYNSENSIFVAFLRNYEVCRIFV